MVPQSVRRAFVALAIPAFLLLAGRAPAFAAETSSAQAGDLTRLSIEQLMNLEVVTASKFIQTATEAPAAVTVVTSADIGAYGYRTLSDVLRSVRGMYVTNDRYYDYLGVRGFGRTGDYNSRVLLLIDGYRTSDPLYDSALIGSEFPLDMDLVDRVEIVSGPGSSNYGSNAIFAVINVIPKSPDEIGGLQLSGSYGGFGTDQERLTFGKRLDNGLGVMLSASHSGRDGRDLFFKEFDAPETNNGVAHRLDWYDSKQLFGRLDYGGVTLTAVHSRWERSIPTGAWSVVFNDPHIRWIDEDTFLDLKYYHTLSSAWSLSARLNYGRYGGHGVYPYAGETLSSPVVLNRDEALAEWWAGEMSVVGSLGSHKLVVGGELQDNFRQDQKNFDVEPAALFLDDHRDTTRLGLYAEDEVRLGSGWIVSAGARYDRYSGVGDTLNPRIAVIWKTLPTTTFKLIYGTAFRSPNLYELYYNDGGLSAKANPRLRPEKSRSYEFIAEHYLQPNFKITLDSYYNIFSNLIEQVIDPADGLLIYENTGALDAKGVEFELERIWRNGVRLRASYAWQVSRLKGSGVDLVNSPRSLAKVNLSVPLWNDQTLLGAEAQYMSSRRTLAGATAGAHVIANLTFVTSLAPRLQLSASLYNLFDQTYSDPAGPETVQDQIRQDGLSFRIRLSHTF